MSEAPTVKGASLKGMQAWCRQKFGKEEFVRLLDSRFEPGVRQLMKGDVFASKDYPVELQNRFLADLAAIWGANAEQEIRAMGRFCAQRDLSGIFRVFLMLFSAMRTIESFGGLWRKYQNTGEVVFTLREEGHGVFEVRDPHSSPLHSVLVAGYVQAALELGGSKDVKLQCTHPEGSTTAVFEARWRA